ncbi:MAG: hypothetical protein AAB972_01975 [Patescibacteria group bacterium]
MANEQAGGAPRQGQGNERPMRLNEILGDANKSGLFADMLKSQNHLDVAERLRMKKTTEQDVELLTGNGMEEFLNRMKSAETLKNMMATPNLAKVLEGKSKKMQSMAKAIGIEGIHGAIVPQLEMLAMKDPTRVRNLIASFEFMTTREKQQKDANTKLNGFFEKYRVSKDAYNEIDNNPDPAQRSLKREQMVHDQMGRIPGWRRKTKEKNAAQRDIDVQARVNELSNRDEITAAKTQYEIGLRNTGDFLGSLMFGNEETQQAFNSILVGENPEEGKAEQMSFEDAKSVVLPEEDGLKQAWDTWSAEETGAQRIPDRDRFFESYVNGKTDNKKGTWRDVMKNIIMGMAKF